MYYYIKVITLSRLKSNFRLKIICITIIIIIPKSLLQVNTQAVLDWPVKMERKQIWTKNHCDFCGSLPRVPLYVSDHKVSLALP